MTTAAQHFNTPEKLTQAISERTTRRQHSALAIGSVIALTVANNVLNTSYEASGHPVGYAEGQLAFSGDTIKGYYATMADLGTLGTYVTTQLIDFAFIAATIAIGVFLATRIARALTGSRLRAAAAAAAVLFIVGGAFDVIENLISFVMLADSAGFPDALALPYSAAAALKFAAIGTAAALTFISTLWVAAQKTRSTLDSSDAAVL